MASGPKIPMFFSKKSRGQSLSEFMILLSVMMLYAVVFTVIFSGQQSGQFRFIESLLGKTAAESIGMAADAAYIAGNGSEAVVRIGSIEANISVAGHSVLVSLVDRVVGSPLVTSSVNGNYSSGQKTARNSYGNITIG